MDIRAEKLWLIEHLLKIQDEIILQRIKGLIESVSKKKPEESLPPMSLESFYEKIEESERAAERGDFITQEELREEVRTWKKA